uniref:Putative FecR n=1 Tax=Rhodopseudomonas palustris (strain BisA53) TaxID=316055 RepID=Q07N27_RHOP5
MSETGDHDGTAEPLRREAAEWILRLTSGEATKADLAALARWRASSVEHAAAFAEARSRWRLYGRALEQVARQDQAIPLAMSAPPRLIGRRAWIGGALAATAAAGAAVMVRPPLQLWPSVGELAADHRTATGEQRRLTLSDQVTLDMNTQTSLNLRAAIDQGERIELIAGEAAISTRSRTVELVAADGRALAEAAAFTVRRVGAEVSVSCLSGTVRVERGQQSASLAPSQQVSYSLHGLSTKTGIDIATAKGWLEGDLFFHDEPLSRVVDEVNRYRPGRIILMNAALGQRRITAHFKLNRLDVVISQLRGSLGARIASLPGGVVVVS